MLALASPATAAPRFAAHPTPTEIQASLARFGPRDTVNALFDQRRWDYVSDRIGAGEPPYVALAAKLAPGVDAGTAEDLPIALAFALPRNATAVLTAIRDGGFDVADVCALPFIEDTVDDRPGYQRRALTAVAQVADPKLAALKAACTAALREAT